MKETNVSMPCDLDQDVIIKQMQKILRHPLFAVSNIFQKFLNYVVTETLSGRADNIKEYTIAVYVLNKPAHFTPLTDGVVRVHARRLRDALTWYYQHEGSDDECIITIPKGRYMPVFEKAESFKEKEKIFPGEMNQQKVRIAFLPFLSVEEDRSRVAFTNSLGQMLSGHFVSFPAFSVISYYSMQLTNAGLQDIKIIASHHKAEYMVAGHVAFDFQKVRITAQLIHAATETQVWSMMYTFNCKSGNLFQLADLAVARILEDMKTIAGDFSHAMHPQFTEEKNYRINKKTNFVLSRIA